MERYEAILEQLKKAQSRGLETIENRLDFVAQSLEELIQETRSSIQEAQPQSADECFPLDEIEASLRSYREELAAEQRRAADLEARIDELESAADRGRHATPLGLLRSLDGARSQSELLKELLPAICEHAARAVVLVLRDGQVSAWSGIGFTDGEHLRAWHGDASDSPALATLLEVSRPVSFEPVEDGSFANWLADEATPEEILLIPVVLRGKLMGAIYIDHLPGQPWSPEAAQSLVAQVCWLIDTLQYRPMSSPSLAEAVAVERAFAATTPVERAPAQVPAPEGEPVMSEHVEDEVVDEQVAAGFDPSATVKIDVSSVDISEATDDEPDAVDGVAELDGDVPGDSFEPAGTFEPEVEAPPEDDFGTSDEELVGEAEVPATEPIPMSVQMPVPAVEPEEPEEPEEAEDEMGAPVEVAETPAAQFPAEPPTVKPVQPPPEEPEVEVSEDEARQEEARRFARLLVSEIKLYNEEQVERGREARDLYQRLHEDIDRSREMFDKRIPEEVRATRDFFQDELVRILADGDPDLLGM